MYIEVGREGLEPSRHECQQILSLVCLPIPPPSHEVLLEGIEPTLAEL